MRETTLSFLVTFRLVVTFGAVVMSSTHPPTFDRTHENVSVVIGTSAVLPCLINDIGDHKVNELEAHTRRLRIGFIWA